MTRRDFALLLSPLPLAPLLLALAACGDEAGGSGDRGKGGSGAPLGFELAFAGTAAAAGDAAPAARQAPVQTVTAADLWARIEAGTVRVIDVRTQEEVDSGIIPEAEHIPLDRFDPATLDRSDGREIVLYCRSGNRSALAAERLAAAQGAPAQHLEGGILAWEAAGLPIDKPAHLDE